MGMSEIRFGCLCCHTSINIKVEVEDKRYVDEKNYYQKEAVPYIEACQIERDRVKCPSKECNAEFVIRKSTEVVSLELDFI